MLAAGTRLVLQYYSTIYTVKNKTVRIIKIVINLQYLETYNNRENNSTGGVDTSAY